MIQPDRLHIGASVVFLSIQGLAEQMGVPVEGVETLISIFQLPKVKFPGGEKRYVSLYPLETALFELGLPEAFKKDATIVRTHQELCGVLYGTLSKAAIKERVKALARGLKDKKPPGRPRRKPRS